MSINVIERHGSDCNNNNNNTYSTEIVCEMDWIHLPQDKAKWQGPTTKGNEFMDAKVAQNIW
jgi:hypothetical protein